MTQKKLNAIARQIVNMDVRDQLKIEHATDDDLPSVLKELGIELPASNWILRVIKIVLYGLGIILAGIGTANAASLWIV